jgi:hypothetical protein
MSERFSSQGAVRHRGPLVGPKVNPTRTRATAALVASVVLHAIVVVSVVPAFTARAPESTPPVEPRDRWSGAPAEVEIGVEDPTHAALAPVEPREEATVPTPAVHAPAVHARKIPAHRPPSSRSSSRVVEAPPAQSAQPAGGEDVSVEKRSLARAFTRALPVANTGDPVWDRLPPGNAGSIVVVLAIDEEGKMLDFEQRGRPHAPAYLVRSVERALLLLRGGRFATAAGAARQAFRLDVTLSDRPADSGPLALGYEPPGTGKSGRAYFQLPSGRFVDVAVSLAGS